MADTGVLTDGGIDVDESRRSLLIGTCTHWGCLPKPRFEPHDPDIGAYRPGGSLCPCQGSRFGLSGRVFEGSPDSVNLRVPPYSFASARKRVIGADHA